jgi:hypothetical protein
MPSLVETALDALGRDDPSEGISLAACFFEESVGKTLGLDRPEVLARPATAPVVARLRDRLVDLVRAGAPAPATGAAVFALGKLHDPGLGPFFVEVLRDQLDRDAGVLYQAMIALDNLGADVFAGRDAMSVAEPDANRALAAAFLHRSMARDST